MKTVPSTKVIDRDNAKGRDYEKSFLVDLAGDKEAIATELAATLGLPLEKLPEGESKPTGADFLIILGTDKQ